MRHLTQILVAGTMVLSPAPANADLGDQLAKLLPDDGAANDHFGQSVAISGNVAIVGARWDDDNGTNSGSAYLYDTTTGQQLFKLLPDDGTGGLFGVSVAIRGTIAIVGASSSNSGSAFLFDITTGQQLFKLLANDGADHDYFGWSVAIGGPPGSQVAIVGARYDDDNGPNSGSAYLFDITTGQQLFKLLADDGAEGDRFGESVAIGGTAGNEVALIGAYRHDDNGENSGSAYLFDTTTGLQIAKLLADDGAAEDWFGFSVAINGVKAIVGAPNDDDNGFRSSSAYLYDISEPMNPVQIAKFLPDDGAAEDRFGWSVAIDCPTAIIGAFADDDNGNVSGSAYFFDATTGQQLYKLLADDGATEDWFGVSVSISGATAIVGAARGDDACPGNPFCDSGSAYLFDASAPGTCPWDLDANTVVGVSDLLDLLADWGPCKRCPADFDGNGSVGIPDLLVLLANWGPCP